MKLKNKKRAFMLFMAMVLATSGCRDNKETEEFKEDYLLTLDNYLDKTSYYNNLYIGKTNAKFYGDFYRNYLNTFIKYMDEDQYNEFIMIVRSMNDDERKNNFIKTREKLSNIMMSSEDNFGYGFYYAFNCRLLQEELTSCRIFDDAALMHINTLKSIINNDEAFYSSLFSEDINNLIDCICENTHFENRELVEELILKYDLIIDLLKEEEKDYYKENLTYEQRELKKQYEARIQEIMSMLVKSKCENDSYFANTFYGQALKESEYYDEYTYSITEHLINDSSILKVTNVENSFMIEVPSTYLYLSTTIEEIKEYKVNKIIEEAIAKDKTDEDYYHDRNVDTATLFFFLLTPNPQIFEPGNDNINSEKVRTLMYEDLKEYFKTEDEFNTYFLYVYSGSSFSLNNYFSLFAKRLEENGITYEDFIRYRALINYNSKRTSVYYDYFYEYSRIPKEDLKTMHEEEYKEFVTPHRYSNLFYNVDYHVGFDSIEDVLRENDLGYTNIYNPDDEIIVWNNGYIYYESGGSKVISSKVSPKMMEYCGTNIIYYEYPEYFEEGEAVEVFQNIDDEFTMCPIEGFKANIIDPKTEEEKTIYIAGIGDSLDEYEDIYFAIYHEKFQAKKELTNGGLYE